MKWKIKGVQYGYPLRNCFGVFVDGKLVAQYAQQLNGAWVVLGGHGIFLTRRDARKVALIAAGVHPEVEVPEVYYR